ncbi:MAG: hypothetical protein KAT70_07690, partial [Thermoplasmata archaeon]|nr:hypothetical protein [Thermoplasmata archaeon]
EVNIEKTRIHGKGSCQKVTGIVVNEKVTLERKKRRQLRAIMHNIEKKGHLSANIENDPFFKERIHGMLSFAKMVDPKFAKPLIVTYQMTDWTAFERQTQILKEDELIERSLKKSTNAIYIKFDEMGFFKDIERIPPSQPIEDVLTRLSSLREKCGEHSKENCRDCLAKQKNLYHGCMKFILGHYTGTTGGHHHGHEMFDISATTEVHGEEMDVAFLLKARDDTNTGNSLLAQFIDNFDSDVNQVISIVSPVAINRGTNSRIKVIVREMDSDKYLCLILRQEMIRILYDFGKKYPKVYSFK